MVVRQWKWSQRIVNYEKGSEALDATNWQVPDPSKEGGREYHRLIMNANHLEARRS